jgi:predicted nicotinamide N-methyase
MSGFSVDWLNLRAPFDHAARESAAAALDLPGRLARWRKRAPGEALAVIDLACGHGANLRALAPALGGAQHWRLVDHDPALLATVPDALAEWARRSEYRFMLESGAGDEQAIDIAGLDFHARVVCQHLDLARGLESLDFGETPLVTTCALLDLVSAPWLQMLIRKAQAARAALLFGLNVDGRTTWDPVDPDDERVHRLFSQHQRRDKGFGPALGSQAAAVALHQMVCAGYETLQTQTDWVIDGAQAPEMQLAMIEGMAAAALEQDPAAQGVVLAWETRRIAGIAIARLRVGHVDIVATPA